MQLDVTTRHTVFGRRTGRGDCKVSGEGAQRAAQARKHVPPLCFHNYGGGYLLDNHSTAASNEALAFIQGKSVDLLFGPRHTQGTPSMYRPREGRPENTKPRSQIPR